MTVCPALFRIFLGTGLLASSAAIAKAPVDFDTAPLLPICITQFQEIGKVVDARFLSVPEPVILKLNKAAPAELALPEELIEGVYAHPELPWQAAKAYAMWSCHAKAHGQPAAPLASVHNELTRCFGMGRNPCAYIERHRVLGVLNSDSWKSARATPDLSMVRDAPTDEETAQDRKLHVPIAGSCAMPAYPKKSLANEETGVVTLRYLIDAKGAVVEGKVAKSSGSDSLDDAARHAFALCKYKPLLRNGKPVWGFVQSSWAFTLD